MSAQVRGKAAVLVDDMIDTAGTISNAARVCREQGAREVRVKGGAGTVLKKSLAVTGSHQGSMLRPPTAMASCLLSN